MKQVSVFREALDGRTPPKRSPVRRSRRSRALLDVTYTWGYQETRQKLRDLYDKAVRAQWISDDVLPWNTDVDLEQPMGPEQLMPLFGSDIYNADDREGAAAAINIETFAWTLSQFLHGEQGALLATAQLVDSVQRSRQQALRGERRSSTRRATSTSTTATSTRRSGSRIRATRT